MSKRSTMRILCITHADFETPGVIVDWTKKHTYFLSVARPYAGEDDTDIREYDFHHFGSFGRGLGHRFTDMRKYAKILS